MSSPMSLRSILSILSTAAILGEVLKFAPKSQATKIQSGAS